MSITLFARGLAGCWANNDTYGRQRRKRKSAAEGDRHSGRLVGSAVRTESRYLENGGRLDGRLKTEQWFGNLVITRLVRSQKDKELT